LPEVVIIAIVAIVIFGPKKIPELGNALGKTLRGFKEELNSDDETTAEQEKQ
jgi:sec-independent protein translocase protein TatA